MRLSLVVLCLGACKGEATHAAAPVAASSVADDSEGAQAPSTEPSASPPTSDAGDAGNDAHAASPGPSCLRRDPSHDDLCKPWSGDAKRYYTWRFDVCKDGLPRTDRERSAAVGRCIAIGPHRAFNLQNWCCP